MERRDWVLNQIEKRLKRDVEIAIDAWKGRVGHVLRDKADDIYNTLIRMADGVDAIKDE